MPRVVAVAGDVGAAIDDEAAPPQQGGGAFEAAVTYPVPDNSSITVTAADLDGDADLDLIVDSTDEEQFLQVFRNAGTGIFAAPIIVPTAIPDSVFPIVADLNRDGIPDIAVGAFADQGFSVLLADGAGGYRPATVHGNPVLSIVQAAAASRSTSGLRISRRSANWASIRSSRRL